MFDPVIAYLLETSNVLNQEVNYIRAEMHEAQQFLDRKQIDEDEENERQYRDTMERCELWGDPRLNDTTPEAGWPDVPNRHLSPLQDVMGKAIAQLLKGVIQ